MVITQLALITIDNIVDGIQVVLNTIDSVVDSIQVAINTINMFAQWHEGIILSNKNMWHRNSIKLFLKSTIYSN